MECANTTNVEFIVDPKILFYGWLIYSHLHVSWSSDGQGSVQIGSLSTLCHDHITCIDDTAAPAEKQHSDKWACAELWTCPFKQKVWPQKFVSRILCCVALVYNSYFFQNSYFTEII